MITNDPKRLGAQAFARLKALDAFSDHPDHLERLYLSPAHRKAADAVAAMMQEAGCDSVSIDALGTVVGRYEAKEPGCPALLIGSHIDTVKDAGSYDGMLGVIAGIGVIEALHEAGERLDFAVEVLAFGDEENVRFPSNLSSSRAIAGSFDFSTLDGRDENGISLRESLIAFGGNPDGIAALARRKEDVIGYIEMHIEQGPVLDQEDRAVGIVTAISGASRRRVIVTGEAGHAGTVPMALRRDSLMAAAEMALAIEKLGAKAENGVATIGQMQVEPGAVNVIPGRVRFTVDARAPNDSVREQLLAEIEAALRVIASRRKVSVEIQPFYDAPAAPASPTMMQGLAAAMEARQMEPRYLPSGAGHDAMVMGALCPMGMMFVRCKAGISHNPAESMTEADAGLAIGILLDFVRGYHPA
jgi:allantoate deiminase